MRCFLKTVGYIGLALRVDLYGGALDLGVGEIQIGDKNCHWHVLRESTKGGE